LEKVPRRRIGPSLADEVNEITLRCAALPDLDTRTPMRSSDTTSTDCRADGDRRLGIDRDPQR